MLFRRPPLPVARIGRSVPESRLGGACMVRAMVIAGGLGVAGTPAWSGPLPAIPNGMPQPCQGAAACGGRAFVPNTTFGATLGWSDATRTLTVSQPGAKAILNWNSFNVAPDGTVVFNQPGAGSATLNRIWQGDPSVIQGHIQAPGQVYLINRNGIIFSPTAQVSVGGLLASTLNLQDSDYLSSLFNAYQRTAPLLSDQDESGNAVAAPGTPGDVDVQPGARIQTTGVGGRVLLAAPNVSNAGEIRTPDGQTILAAGNQVYVNTSSDVRGLWVGVDAGGAAHNLGSILAQRGNVTLAGLTVNQDGVAHATSSVNYNGSVYLVAGDTQINAVTHRFAAGPQNGGKLSLGGVSSTAVLPELGDATTAVDTQSLAPGAIRLQAANIQLQSGASVVAPGGSISLSAHSNPALAGSTQPVTDPATGSIDIAAGATIDASGLQNVDVSVTRNFVSAELRGNELQDSPVQRNRFLYGRKVMVDARGVDANGNIPLANVAGYVAGIGRTVAERSTRGGTISLDAGSSVNVHAGATLDVSGGSVNYQGGYAETTRLLGADGKLYNLMTAPKDMLYVGFGDSFTFTDSKWNQTRTIQGAAGLGSSWVAGYVEGRDAGAINVLASQAALDGALVASTTRGANQRTLTPLVDPKDPGNWSTNSSGEQVPPANLTALYSSLAPAGGQFNLGNTQALRNQDVVLAEAPAGGAAAQLTYLPAQRLATSGFSQIDVEAAGTVTLPQGNDLHLPAGGQLVINANRVELDSSIVAPAGNVSVQARQPNPLLVPIDPLHLPPDPSLVVAAGATLSTRGLWINDSPLQQGVADPASLKAIDGGAADASASGKYLGISLVSSGQLTLGAGSLLDVSGGAYVSSAGAVTAGAAGTITLRKTADYGGQLVLGGRMQGTGLAAGGSLAISAPQVRIGTGVQASGQTLLDPGLFGSGGFRNYSITGQAGLQVDANVAVDARAVNFVLPSNYLLKASGTSLYAFASPALLPDALRNNPENITLATTLPLQNPDDGSAALVIGPGASIATDAGGSISLRSPGRIDEEGTLLAPSGRISLTIDATPLAAIGYRGQQAIWLGAGARLLAPEVASPVTTDALGFHRGGLVADGANAITLNAQRGFIVAQAGAVLDVSGASTTVDITQADGHTVVGQHLSGNAGTVSLASASGILFDGTLRAARGGVGAAGGTLTVNLDQNLGTYASASSLSNDVGAPTEIDRVVLSDRVAGQVPAGLKPGDIIDPAEMTGSATPGLGGTAALSTALLGRSGLDRINLRARDELVMQGDVHLAVKQSLVIDAPVIRADGAGTADLTAAYLALGQPNAVVGPATVTPHRVASGAHLALHGKLLDVTGDSSIQGFDDVTLQSAGDLRFTGTNKADGNTLTGSLAVDGSLVLDAAQVYPTTISSITVSATDALTVANSAAASAATPWSAGGSITLKAPVIAQDGTLRAPLGQVALAAAYDPTDPQQYSPTCTAQPAQCASVTLGSGSLTSVSAAGVTIPFGQVQNGTTWVYPLTGTQLAENSAPLKALRFSAGNSVSVAAKATLDASGGGDLLGYGFVSGPGGSKDILSGSNIYAIVPGTPYAAGYAPYDPWYASSGSALRPGDTLTLSGGVVPAGTYTLLPAHYALLPGAYAVRLVTGSDPAPGAVRTLRDGSYVVAGKRGVLGSGVADARWSAWQVLPNSVVHQYSELDVSAASAFYPARAAKNQVATPVLPADAGVLSLAAGQRVDLSSDARFDFAAATGGRSGEVDFVADKLAIVSSQSGDATLAGYLQLDAATLDALTAERLVIGATRVAGTASDGGDTLQVSASSVVVANDAAHGLAAQDLVLASKGTITVRSGSDLSTVQSGASLTAPGSLAVDGAGALVRLTQGSLPALTRTNASSGAGGTLEVQPGARLAATGSVTLDASAGASLGTSTLLEAPALRVDGRQVALGEVPPGAASGEVVLGTATLAQARQLYLQGAQSIDLYGNVNLGSTSPLTSLTLDTPLLRGIGTGTRAIQAQSVELTASNAATAVNAAAGAGPLTVTAQTVVIGPGQQSLSGFAASAPAADQPAVTLAASSELRARGSGALAVTGDLTLSAPRFDADSGASLQVSSDGLLRLAGAPGAAAGAAAGAGAHLAFSAARIEDSATLVVPAGQLSLEANGSAALTRAGAAGGAAVSLAPDVVLAAGASISADGYSHTFQDLAATADAGTISLRSDHGNLVLETGSSLSVRGVAGGAAGQVSLSAAQGVVKPGAVFDASAGAAGGSGGALLVDAGQVDAATFATLAGAQAAGGFTRQFEVRTRSGDIAVAPLQSISAHDIGLTADSGRISIAGALLADGTPGAADAGAIRAWAGQGLTVAAGARLSASGAGNGHGGVITLGTLGLAGGTLDLQAGAGISATGSGGVLRLRAPRTGAGAGSDVAISEVASTVNTNGGVLVEGVQTYGTAANPVTLDSNFLANTVAVDDAAFLSNESAILARLGGAAGNLRIEAGVEVDSTATSVYSLASALDFSSLRGGSALLPGTLTVRAAGDLEVSGQLSDGFVNDPRSALLPKVVGSDQSWSYRLVAGADLASADPTAVNAVGAGSLRLDSSALVRTGTGGIGLFAAQDIDFARNASGGASVYTAGRASPYPASLPTFAAPFYNSGIGAGRTPFVAYAQFTQDGGDLEVRAGHDVVGSASTQLVNDWLYRSGAVDPTTGAYLTVGRIGSTRGYDQTAWWVEFARFAQDLGALGGGNVNIHAGGAVADLSASIPTNGRLGGGINTRLDAGSAAYVEGGGNLSVTASGDILGGSYYVQQGSGRLDAGGAVGVGRIASYVGTNGPLLALGAAGFAVDAQGDVNVLSAYNPMLAPMSIDNEVRYIRRVPATFTYFSSYDAGSSLSLRSTAGNATLGNTLSLVGNALLSSAFDSTSNPFTILPPTVSVAALQGKVRLGSDISLAPSPTGNLTLLAAGSVDLRKSTADTSCSCIVSLSDVSMSAVPTAASPQSSGSAAYALLGLGANEISNHAPEGALHAGDSQPVRIYADSGSILGTSGGTSGTTVLAGKSVRLAAGQDIVGVSLYAQNLAATDVTLVDAGRDIIDPPPVLTNGVTDDATKMLVTGPGQFMVMAGRNIDIGTSVGLLTSTNTLYQPSTAPGANLSVYAGLGAGSGGAAMPDYAAFIQRYIAPSGTGTNPGVTPVHGGELVAFMRRLGGEDQTVAQRKAIEADYASLDPAQQNALAHQAWAQFQALGPLQQAALVEQVMGSELRAVGLAHTLNGASYQAGYADIATLFPATDASGAARNYFGDISLVYSQIKTLGGGDLGLFTPGGEIDAGLATTPPGVTLKAPTDLGIVTQKSGSIVGVSSGNVQVNSSRVFAIGGGDILLWSSAGNIDAGKGAKTTVLIPPPSVAILPTGEVVITASGASTGSGIGALITGPGDTPGNVDLIAPLGAVDAGDAGIRASGNLNIAAARVVNSANISVGGVATGVPPASPASIASSLPSGNSSSNARQAGEDSTKRLADSQESGDQLSRSFKPTFVTVDVVGCDDSTGSGCDDKRGR